MKQYHILIAFSLLATIGLTSCGDRPQNAPNNIATPVSVVELKKGSISKLINTTGTVQPTYGVSLNSEMSGFYKLQINPKTGKTFKMGDRVSKGTIIVRLEDKEYENGRVSALSDEEILAQIDVITNGVYPWKRGE